VSPSSNLGIVRKRSMMRGARAWFQGVSTYGVKVMDFFSCFRFLKIKKNTFTFILVVAMA